MKKPLTITNISDFIFIKLDFISMFEYQCVKSVRIRNFSGPHFRTSKNSEYEYFSRRECFKTS